MKINFYIDYQEDLSYVLARLTRLDPAGIENRLKDKDIDTDTVKKILSAPSREEKFAILDNFLKDFYAVNQDHMEKIRSFYQTLWEGKTDIFFATVTPIMGSKEWNYKTYLFLVSSFFSRAQWGKGNRLAVWWKRDPRVFWHLNGYELILSHVFEIVDQTYDKRPVSDWHLWALAESIAYIFVYREERLKAKLWPDLKEPERFSYPQLLRHIGTLDQMYKKASNFDDFIQGSIEYIKNYSQEQLTQTQS